MSWRRTAIRAVRGSVLALLVAVTRPAAAQAPTDDPLSRRITIKLDPTDLASALTRLRTFFGVPLAFSLEALPAGTTVSINANDQTVRTVLATILEGTGLHVVPTKGGAIVITPGSDPEPAPEPAASRTPTPALATGIAQLDQIVVMGTPVAGAPEREQPNAVSVVKGDELDRYHFSRTADLFRTALPGVILWDRGPSGPPAEIAAVRGASSFTARGLKTYLDGVEVASPTLISLVDPRSIERIEVIRGPQGAALYGSDAIDGVIQIVTRKGQLGEQSKVHFSATAAAGPFDREALPTTMLRQDYAGNLSWSGPSSSFAVDGSLSRLGTTQDIPNTRSWTLHGAGQMVLGPVLVSAMFRGGQFNFVQDPIFGLPVDSIGSQLHPASVDLATVGVTAVHQLSQRWTQTLVAGFDRTSGAITSTGYSPGLIGSHDGPWVSALANNVRQPLAATDETAQKASLRYSTTLNVGLGANASSAFTFGLEHTRTDEERGAWEPTREAVQTFYQDAVKNTGTFVQAKLRAGPLVINAGTRAEWSNAFGADYGAAWAPSIGASWATPLGSGAVLRLRTGWGRGIRPPELGMSRSMATSQIRQEGNPNLAPETQAGIEFGTELFFGTGTFIRATWFNQRASDLIQSVAVAPPPGAPTTYQFQNVGAIRNRGIELEAGFKSGHFEASGLLYTTKSTVEQLAAGYSGYLKVGDEPPELPTAAGALRIGYSLAPIQFSLGASYLGSWKGYDWAGLVQDAQSGSGRPYASNYVIRYPSVLRPYLSLSVDVARRLTAFTNIDNLFNQIRYEQHNGSPPPGRSLLVGFEVRP
jgi:iron complex outermembrane receptor protein